MTSRRWILSLALLYHVAAVGVDAIPAPEELHVVTSEVRPGKKDATAARLTPVFERVAVTVARVDSTLYAALQPVRTITRPYINAGLGQNWRMFTDPDLYDRYLRIDYDVLPSGSHATTRIEELVLPLSHEDRIRVLHDFRDKAIINVIFALRENARPRSTTEPAEVPGAAEGFVPVVRYFKNRYQARELSAGDRITRAEVWYGSAAIPPRGESVPEETLRARLDVLNGYYFGPVPSRRTGAPQQAGAVEREADISWELEYVDNP